MARKPCPRCSQQIKEENLAGHLARVHPDVPRRDYRTLGVRKPTPEPWVWRPWMTYAVVLVLLAASLGTAAVYLGRNPRGSEAGVLSPDHTFYDFGTVSQTTVEHEFRLKADGMVKIEGAWSSCECTSAHFLIGLEQSPHFGMHNNQAWQRQLAPGEEVTLVVLYDATAHGDRYEGERSVFVKTDSSAQPEMEFRIRVKEV